MSKATSTIEFHPLNNENVVYLFISEITITNRENREIKYVVKEGKKTMGDRHVKVFEVED